MPVRWNTNAAPWSCMLKELAKTALQVSLHCDSEPHKSCSVSRVPAFLTMAVFQIKMHGMLLPQSRQGGAVCSSHESSVAILPRNFILQGCQRAESNWEARPPPTSSSSSPRSSSPSPPRKSSLFSSSVLRLTLYCRPLPAPCAPPGLLAVLAPLPRLRPAAPFCSCSRMHCQVSQLDQPRVAGLTPCSTAHPECVGQGPYGNSMLGA